MERTKGELILVPLDGSAESEAAIPYAITLGRALNASLRLLSVVDSQTGYPFPRVGPPVDEVIDLLRDQLRSYLAERLASLQAQGLDASTAVAEGNPAEEILRDAAQVHASLIAMATHGRSGLQRWVLGSVTDKVMRSAQVPTLLVPSLDQRSPVEPVDLRTLLLPLDGSSLAEAAIAPGVRLAEALGAKLLLLRIEPPVNSPANPGSDGSWQAQQAETERDAERLAREYIAAVRSHVPPAVECEGIVERGNVTPALEAAIAKRRVDLVVMSTHGRGGLTRLVLGSNADRLVRAGVPTLLVRSLAVPESHVAKGGVGASAG